MHKKSSHSKLFDLHSDFICLWTTAFVHITNAAQILLIRNQILDKTQLFEYVYKSNQNLTER